MVKAVFDTVVFVRSLINPYGRWGELVFKYHDRYQLCVSHPIVEEYLEVLYRKELTSKFKTLLDVNLEKIIELVGQAPVVNISSVPPPVSRDVKDNKFLATAQAAKVDYLVSEDNDLLDLKQYRGIKIITGLDFLHILDKIKNNPL